MAETTETIHVNDTDSPFVKELKREYNQAIEDKRKISGELTLDTALLEKLKAGMRNNSAFLDGAGQCKGDTWSGQYVCGQGYVGVYYQGGSGVGGSAWTAAQQDHLRLNREIPEVDARIKGLRNELADAQEIISTYPAKIKQAQKDDLPTEDKLKFEKERTGRLIKIIVISILIIAALFFVWYKFVKK